MRNKCKAATTSNVTVKCNHTNQYQTKTFIAVNLKSFLFGTYTELESALATNNALLTYSNLFLILMCEKMWLDEFAMVRLRRFVQFHQGQASSTKVKRVPPRSNEFHQGQTSSTKVKHRSGRLETGGPDAAVLARRPGAQTSRRRRACQIHRYHPDTVGRIYVVLFLHYIPTVA